MTWIRSQLTFIQQKCQQNCKSKKSTTKNHGTLFWDFFSSQVHFFQRPGFCLLYENLIGALVWRFKRLESHQKCHRKIEIFWWRHWIFQWFNFLLKWRLQRPHVGRVCTKMDLGRRNESILIDRDFYLVFFHHQGSGLNHKQIFARIFIVEAFVFGNSTK